MNQLTNQELFIKLQDIINALSTELKAEIKSINTSVSQKIENFEGKLREIQESIAFIERANRKNNIVIFGIETDRENLLKTTISQLNNTFGCNLQERDINNLYVIGKKNTIIVEFVSYLSKKFIFKQLYKLKGTGISITNDLRPEDQKINKTLVKHLKEARAKNQKAHIKNLKLYVNGVPYTIEELENPTEIDCLIEHEVTTPLKNHSAPATPTIRQIHSKEPEEVFVENKPITEESKKEKTPHHQNYTPTTSKNNQINTKVNTAIINKNTKSSEPREARTLRTKKSTS